ncbi:MAG: ATP-binding protein [Flavipsychrobacter sp.]|nr:ATP-binding protein [Flavipsychrobacter sp.]
MKKIVVIGPESTGKSTLSRQLADALGTQWVPEYAREYLEQLARPYEEADLLQIAKGQLRSEDEQAMKAGTLLVCDTDLQVVRVWSEHRYDRCHKWILEAIARRRYDLYLLTNIDVAWEEDPLREHREHSQRHYFYNIYRDIVQQSGLPWADISGGQKERLERALEAIRNNT